MWLQCRCEGGREKIRQELLKEAAQLLEEEQQNLELKDNGPV